MRLEVSLTRATTHYSFTPKPCLAKIYTPYANLVQQYYFRTHPRIYCRETPRTGPPTNTTLYGGAKDLMRQ
eukprot:SAG11_NODE_44_length_20765_cov_5.183635_25_plen_71_part_00